jgi:hypothetical protein
MINDLREEALSQSHGAVTMGCLRRLWRCIRSLGTIGLRGAH